MKRLSLIALFSIAGLLHAQSAYAPRANFGARLEPQGVLVQGAGQDSAAYGAYWSVMPIGRQPQVYMYYIGLGTLTANWADSLKAQLLQYPESFIIPQIGLSMSNGATAHYEADVAAGVYDTQIGYLVSGPRELATPVYLRIGYEFNGPAWNGYLPGPYAQAYVHVTNALRAAPDVEVATVWDASMDGGDNFMDYYPGDAYVDWFGMNIFSGSSFSDPALATFISLARSHQKPVMLGELTPRTIGAQAGAASWTGWFGPFFSFLQTTPEVKEFNYIDWNWAAYPQWATWGDARLETDTATYVRNLYVAQLADPTFLNDASESSFRQLLGYNDTTPPPAVSNLSVSPAPGGATLTWTPVTDPSGLARYYLYRNNTLLDYALAPPYTDLSVGLGTSNYGIAAMDRAGNMSPQSAQSVTLSQIQRLINGDFENGLTGWQLQSNAAGAAGTAVIDATNPIDGKASVKINVSQTTGTNWNLQFQQQFQMTAGLTYTVSFKARASAPVTLPVVIQQVGGNYSVYLGPNFTATTTTASFQYSMTATTSQPVGIDFYVADIGNTTLWLDDVSVVESNPGQIALPPNLLASGVRSAASFQPGVVPGSFMAIQGANLSPVASDTWNQEIASGQLPTSLDGVSVSIGNQPAYIEYVSPGQINIVAPNLSPGPATLTVTTPAGTTAPVTVNVAAQAPAFFLWPGNQAVATRTDWSFAVKAGTFPGVTTEAAHPGDIIILWGTGFGATTPALAPGIEPPTNKLYACDPVTATLGATSVAALSCDVAPGYAALYQVAIQLPTSLAGGDYPLKVMIDNATSPDGVILSVANK